MGRVFSPPILQLEVTLPDSDRQIAVSFETSSLEIYNEFSKRMGQLYLEKFAQRHRVNTLVMESLGSPVKIHSTSYKEGDRELIMHWEKQVEWAQTINERLQHGEQIVEEDAVESSSILLMQSEITKFAEALKPLFIKRGLPFPPTVKSGQP